MRSYAETLSDSLRNGLAALPIEKEHQIAVDGPIVNWKILRLIIYSWDKEEHPPFWDIGCCGLHVVSGALDTGVAASSWTIEKVLGAMFSSLHNSPARRAEYLRVSSSGLYPKKFCTIWWVKNDLVANRVIEIKGDIAELTNSFAAKVPSKRPKDNASYNNLKEHYTNPFIIVYLHLFRDIAARLNGFFIKFQTDGPMVPFLSEEKCKILRWFMGFFILKEVLKAADTSYKLSKLQV